MTDNFTFSCTITKKKFPILFSMKKKDREIKIMSMLELGYSCYFRDPNEFKENIPDNLYTIAQNKEIMDMLNRLTGICNNSSKKGLCGENILEDIIKKRYGDITFEKKSLTPHSGDAWLYLPDNK